MAFDTRIGILYKRMIDREHPAQISKKQAVVPVLLGILSTGISFGIFLGFAVLILKSGFSTADGHLLLRSFIFAFIQAGLPEELAKLLMILLALYLFRSTVTNVYEYILIGMAVGFGFTLFEEVLYGSDGWVFRLTGVAIHSALNMVMAKHLALARYYKRTNEGSVAGEYALAILVPVLIHTCYDTNIWKARMQICSSLGLSWVVWRLFWASYSRSWFSSKRKRTRRSTAKC